MTNPIPSYTKLIAETDTTETRCSSLTTSADQAKHVTASKPGVVPQIEPIVVPCNCPKESIP